MKIKNLLLAITLSLVAGTTFTSSEKVFASENVQYKNEEDKTIFLKDAKNTKTTIDTANWMRDYAQNETPLGRLSIPGTHDSAAFKTWSLQAVARPWAVTQEKDIIQQLHMGVRYLDFRSSSNFYMYHGGVYVGHDLLTHFKEVTEFLKSHKDEFVVIRLKNERGNATEFAKRLDREIFSNENSEIRKYLAVNPSLDEKVGNLRGKIVLLNDLGVKINFPTIDFKNVEKQDNWLPNTYDDKLMDIVFFNMGVQNENKLTLNHVSFTYSPKTIWNISKEMNKRVYEYLENNYYSVKNTGVLIFDYPSKELINEILQRNFLSRKKYLTTKPVEVVKTEDSLDKFVLLSGINELPYDDVSKIEFDNIPSIETTKNAKVVAHITFVDGSKTRVVIPVNVKEPVKKQDENEKLVNVYKYNATKELSKGELKTSFKENALTVHLKENEDIDKEVLKEFFYKYYDLSNVLDSKNETVENLIDYAIMEFIEPKEEYKFYLSELQSLKYVNEKIVAESYYKDGTHIVSEIPVILK